MNEVVICEPVRTPIGRYGGIFKGVTAVELAVAALRGLFDRTGIPGEVVGDVVLGHCFPDGEAPAIGRVAALDVGLPPSVAGLQVDRRDGSGLQAVIQACLQVGSGAHDLVVAGGVESVSNVAFYSNDLRWGAARQGVGARDGLIRPQTTAGGCHYVVPGGLRVAAEKLRRQYAITRAEQDELARESYRRAVCAQDSGVFRAETVPVAVSTRTAIG